MGTLFFLSLCCATCGIETLRLCHSLLRLQRYRHHCVTPLWCGPSGHLADPTPNTIYEPKYCIDVSSEHTPMNLPARKSSFQLESDATIAASEDLNLPRHSRASSSSRHTAASTVPTLLKQSSVGTGSRNLAADVDHEKNCSKFFRICV